jgi:hypothetical protein
LVKAVEAVMTVRLEIKPEIEASLNAQAAAVGVPLDEYLRNVIEDLARARAAPAANLALGRLYPREHLPGPRLRPGVPSSPTVRRSAVALCLPTMGLGVVRTAKSTGDKKHFFYEADRGSMVMTDMLKKFRGHYHLVKKQQRHREAVGVHPIRAVLVETTDTARGQKLMELVNHP